MMRWHRWKAGAVLFLALLMVVGSVRATEALDGIRIHEFTLSNGMLFLVVERHTTPQVACRLAIRAGSALEDTGRTGIAHLLEHMLFKGTKNYGTLDWERDQALQAEIEAAYQVVRREQFKREPDRTVMDVNQAAIDRLRAQVQEIYVPQALSWQAGRNGAVGVNAFTSKDQTQYMMALPSDMLEQWFSLASEQVFEPAWREFYVEREVVQREWAYRYVNNPEGAAWLDLYATAYIAHPYRNPVIGWKADMQNLTATDAAAFHRTYYNPNNAVAVLVGDVKPAEVERLARTYFERYPKGPRAPERVTAEPAQEGPRRSIRYLPGARSPLVRIGFPGAAMGTPDFYALDVLSMILGYGRGARLTQELVNQGLALDAWAANPDNRYGGMVILGASPPDPAGTEGEAYLKACEDVEALLLAQVAILAAEPVAERELKRVKKLNQRDFLERLRSNEALAGTLATLEVQVGWRYLEQYLGAIEAVTAADVQRVAGEYLAPEKRTSVYLLPGKMPERAPEPYAEIRSVSGRALSRLERPANLVNHSVYPTPAGWRHPLSFERRPARITYPAAERFEVKGVPGFYLPDHELPLISLTLLVKSGTVDIPAEQAGLGTLLDHSLVRGGTQDLSPEEMALRLDENAIRLGVRVGEEDTAITLSVLKEDWDKGLDMLRAVLTAAAFPDDILKVTGGDLAAGLRRQSEDAQAVAAREAEVWHFQGHPYGRDPLAALETLPTLKAADLKAFMARWWVPANMVVTLAGDIGLAAAQPGLEALLAALPQQPAPERVLPAVPATPPVLAVIDKPGQVQSQVRLVLPSVTRQDPDYWKINLLTDIFGGHNSLLYLRLRDDLGLVYGTWFQESYKWEAGFLAGYMGCRGDRTGQALAETAAIMQGLRRSVPATELEQKRLDVLNSFVFNVDTPEALVEVYGRYFLRGEPLDTLETIQDVYFGATAQDLTRLADKYLDPARLQIFVVGDLTLPVRAEGVAPTDLRGSLAQVAREQGWPFKELPLR